jgi:hypothetical protein
VCAWPLSVCRDTAPVSLAVAHVCSRSLLYCQVFKERKDQLDVEEKKVEHAKAELEGINETIRQMEAYDRQMKSDIAVTRRETYGAEEAVTKAEKAKLAQDLYIDRMSEDFKAKSEELALYESRLATQRSEAKQAASTLAEAVKEMEIIQSEKKQLLLQWQSTLVAISKRDEALQVLFRTAIAVVLSCSVFPVLLHPSFGLYHTDVFAGDTCSGA